MRILFLGQLGIPVFGRPDAGHAERRVEAVATALVRSGQEAAVTCASPFIPRTVRTLGGTRLLHRTSFDSRQPGGWLYSLLEVLAVRRVAPQAIHLHGWRQALLAPLTRRLAGEAAMVLTVDAEPQRRLERYGLAAALRAVDAITAPSRAVQSQLLQECGVVADYVPDGYQPTELPLLPPSSFGVRKNQTYYVAAAASPAALRWLCAAGKQIGLRRKVFVLADAGPRERRLVKRYPFLYFVGTLRGRRLASLLKGAAGMLLLEAAIERSLLLQAMQAGLPVIATTDSLIQETAGVTARYVRANNVADLVDELKQTLGSPHKRRYYGGRGRKRAQAHFTWDRITEEYAQLYAAPFARVVAVDSVAPGRVRAVTHYS